MKVVSKTIADGAFNSATVNMLSRCVGVHWERPTRDEEVLEDNFTMYEIVVMSPNHNYFD